MCVGEKERDRGTVYDREGIESKRRDRERKREGER